MALAVFNSASFISAAGLAVAANATIEVRREDTGVLASIYSNEAGTTPITNPSNFADASGRFTFYAAGIASGYDILVTKGAESFRLNNVAIGTMAQLDAAEFSASSGSSLVGHIASGTGAVAETVQAALRRTVSAEQFGFATSATTSVNGAALQAAIDAVSTAGGGEVQMGVGTFSFNGVTRKAGVSLVGSGFKSTILSYTGSGVAIESQDVFQTVDGGKCLGFKLTTTTSSPSVGPGTIGIALRNSIDVGLDGLEVRGFSTSGVDLISTTGKSIVGLTVSDCHIHENTKNIRHTGVNMGANAIKITRSRIRAGVEWNIYAEIVGLGWDISGNTLESGGTGGSGGSVFLRQAYGVVLHGNYFEQTAALPAIEFSDTQSAYGVSIKGNYIKGVASGASVAIKLGTSAYVYGAEISGNYFDTWITAISVGAAIGAQLGPNAYSTVTNETSTPGAGHTGIVVHGATNWKLWNASLAFNSRSQLSYSSPTTATNAALGNLFFLVVSTNDNFTLSNPTNPTAGQVITFDIKNSSGVAMGVITWDTAFKLAGAFTNPANTKLRTITFYYDGTNWIETGRAAADI